MDSLSGFVVFNRVAETRSFVAAGQSLGISASAVGKRVARLEGRLGVRLFHRSTRSITLTAEGALFLERSRRILAEIEATEQELSQANGAPRGRLRVSLPQVTGLVMPALAEFMARYPDIELDLDFSDRMVDIIGEGFDVVMRGGQPLDSRLNAKFLGHFQHRLVASPDYLREHGQPAHPRELAGHRCLHYRFPSSGKLETWPLRREHPEQDYEIPISMVCNHVETRICFALNHRGITCLPDFSVRAALASGSLVSVLDDFIERRGSFYLLWPSGRQVPPRLRVFIDFMLERVFPGNAVSRTGN
ncbi:LysR family transcriptional regulator [Pseudomonas sichuanensis]|uniref:LysR family transcriptional regulator n=1 Tax=Pseudomonas TaxID=286 RepID=UPI002447891A|nr:MULTISPECIES: LysR family transcriptional regulator [Pseudomonas]MDH0733134.1 LysR family transcriptional regulator [Pseudomonas sichuanensis]MDH1585294.1 LysR family transcriptional regulator [Pseudomonas sichuanensis]MDH1591951.1 LysR family transcriptional regulator [Pseudomonas sichuanensis]MDH1597275.1 LysR family transcriptional regulator [Pseudomonas sichuanensis]MDU9404163.1 LysR family transcriptional regulator [Pseudomonas sp. zfem004]